MTAHDGHPTGDEPFRSSTGDTRLRFIEPVLEYAELLQLLDPLSVRSFPADRLIQMLGSCSWEETFLKLARIAALLANASDGVHDTLVSNWTTDLLASTLHSEIAEERVVAFYVGLNAPRVVAHEEAIYFLQALAVLYGRDIGPAPTDAQLAFWMLAGNDHCFGWRSEDLPLSDTELLAAVSARSLLFNHHQDALPPFVRSVSILEQVPSRTAEWKDPEAWRAFQRRAFGAPLGEYVDFLVGALYLISVGWGRGPADALQNPTLVPDEWIAGTGAPRDLALRFFERVGASRTELQALLQPLVGKDGLPRGSSAFFIKPFARFASGQLVAASPWVVREQVRGGMWAGLLTQAKAEYGDKGGADRWLPAFGDLFELWCREVAKMAASSRDFRGELVLSETIGDSQEVEDVVVVNDGRALLASAKARTVRQELMKGALSPAKVLDWYKGFLFGERSGDQRGGAVRLLNQNINLVRAGAHVQKGISADCEIFPVLVTYDNLGADNPAFHLWLADRCKVEGLLQQDRVHPLVILHIEKFELLLGYAAAGRDMFEVLRRRGPEQRADVALFDAAEELESTRLPGLVQRFDVLMLRLRTRLATALRRDV